MDEKSNEQLQLFKTSSDLVCASHGKKNEGACASREEDGKIEETISYI